MTVWSGQGKQVGQSEIKEECNIWDTSCFPQVFQMLPSLFTPPHPPLFDFKAAEVISILLIHTSLQGYLIQVYLMSVHEDFFGALFFFPSHLFFKDRWRKEHYSEDKLIYRNYTM